MSRGAVASDSFNFHLIIRPSWRTVADPYRSPGCPSQTASVHSDTEQCTLICGHVCSALKRARLYFRRYVMQTSGAGLACIIKQQRRRIASHMQKKQHVCIDRSARTCVGQRENDRWNGSQSSCHGGRTKKEKTTGYVCASRTNRAKRAPLLFDIRSRCLSKQVCEPRVPNVTMTWFSMKPIRSPGRSSKPVASPMQWKKLTGRMYEIL